LTWNLGEGGEEGGAKREREERRSLELKPQQMQPSTTAVILLVICLECFAYASLDRFLSLVSSTLSHAHPGYEAFLGFVRWLLQALFYALLGWQGMSLMLASCSSQVEGDRGAALAEANERAVATPRARGARAALTDTARAAAQPGTPRADFSGASAAPIPLSFEDAGEGASSVEAARAYAARRGAAAVAGRLRELPDTKLLRFVPCTRDLAQPWEEAFRAQFQNKCLRPQREGDEGTAERDEEAPPGVRATKRRRALQLVVAEQLTPQLRDGMAYASSLGVAVPQIIKIIETTWVIPGARWACFQRELCSSDTVSLGWAVHRVRGAIEWASQPACQRARHPART
jgi:hypothetical protein